MVDPRFRRKANEQLQNYKLVLLHAHMFKNAGTTFDSILQENFGKKFIDHRGDELNRNPEAVYQYLSNHDITALSHHHLPLPMPPKTGWRLFTIAFFRHPIERVASVYRFEKMQKADTLGAKAAKRYSFSDYVRWRIEERPGTIVNFHARYCTSTCGRLPDNELLEKAYESVGGLFLAGIVERFDQSMNLFKNRIEPHMHNIAVQYERRNVTDNREISMDKRLKEIGGLLGDELYSDLTELNEIDLILYERISKQFDRHYVRQ